MPISWTREPNLNGILKTCLPWVFDGIGDVSSRAGDFFAQKEALLSRCPFVGFGCLEQVGSPCLEGVSHLVLALRLCVVIS
jgi:hypothetical protein